MYMPDIRDQTLVAWVSLADLNQRGGSALTLQEQEAFDAIVFAERVPGTWMAGSDFFRRTHREQDSWTQETADSRTLVQVAITYRGNQVTLYRDGRQYGQYTMDSSPQEFGAQSVVVIGKRHLEAAQCRCFGRVCQLKKAEDTLASRLSEQGWEKSNH